MRFAKKLVALERETRRHQIMNAFRLASHVILDAARLGSDFQTASQLQPKFTSLLRGEHAKNLAEVAPYLFEFQAQSKFGEWLFEKSKGKSWGVYLVTSANLEQLRMHLRKFIIVEDENKKKLFYRYYDPRVLRATLPTFDYTDLCKIFGPINEWIAEDYDARHYIRFKLENAGLNSARESYSSSQ